MQIMAEMAKVQVKPIATISSSFILQKSRSNDSQPVYMTVEKTIAQSEIETLH